MANKKVTKNSCNFCIPAAALSDFSLNPRDQMVEAHAADHDKIVIKGSYGFLVKIGDDYFVLDEDVTLSTASDLDTGSIANGKDYYVYACNDSGTLAWKESLASTYPAGFNANTSRKFAGFHTLCANVGTISGHTLTGYVANDVLPASIWDLRHRALNGNNEGLVYDSKIQKWAMIYLASGTGINTTSAYLGTISDTRNWMDFVEDGHAIGMRLPTDHEFQSLAFNSNEETNILGSADPGTTGGHSDTASRRMISDIGCEDCAGALYQWLLDQSWRADGLPDTGDPSWGWYNLPVPGRGSFYKQGTHGDIKLHAGGYWPIGTHCGSRCRGASNSRWTTHSGFGARFLVEPLLGR
jgi:hypothetical protein